MCVDIRSLRHFVAVADTLNFRIAGERLHLSQPALTRSIAALERDLGVRLFNRDTRGVALSSDGAQLLQRARAILSSSDEFTYTAHSLRAASVDQLRIGIYGNGLAELTFPVLRAFTEKYPETALQVSEADFARGIDPLSTGEFDIAFIRAPEDLPVLHTTRLFAEPMDLILPEGHRLAQREYAAVSEIFEDNWVTFPPSIPSLWSSFWLFENERAGREAEVGAFARTEGEFLAAVAFRRLSGVLPTSVLRQHPHPGVHAVRAQGLVLSTVSVAYPASGFSPGAAALSELAAEFVRTNVGLVPEAVLLE